MTLSITLIICALTFLISYQAFNDRKLFENLKHFPYAESRRKEFYRMVTSGFVHGSWMHLLINLFVLYQFGGIVESLYGQIFGKSMGSIMFTLMYITTLIVADIPSYLKHKNDPHYGAIGASGAVSGIVFIYVLFAPWELLYLYAILPIPSIIAAIAYVVYSSWASKNRNDNIGHDAHLYGALYGLLFTIIVYPNSLKIFIERLMVGPSF